jgi:hypothetical protein
LGGRRFLGAHRLVNLLFTPSFRTDAVGLPVSAARFPRKSPTISSGPNRDTFSSQSAQTRKISPKSPFSAKPTGLSGVESEKAGGIPATLPRSSII